MVMSTAGISFELRSYSPGPFGVAARDGARPLVGPDDHKSGWVISPRSGYGTVRLASFYAPFAEGMLRLLMSVLPIWFTKNWEANCL